MADSLVAGWLAEIGLETIISTFREEGIDSEALAALDDSQLKELGVKRMGDRTKLRAKAMGISLPDPFASPQRMNQPPANGELPGAVRGRGVPEHLQVLQRLSASTSPPSTSPNGGLRPRVRTTVDGCRSTIVSPLTPSFFE